MNIFILQPNQCHQLSYRIKFEFKYTLVNIGGQIDLIINLEIVSLMQVLIHFVKESNVKLQSAGKLITKCLKKHSQPYIALGCSVPSYSAPRRRSPHSARQLYRNLVYTYPHPMLESIEAILHCCRSYRRLFVLRSAFIQRGCRFITYTTCILRRLL